MTQTDANTADRVVRDFCALWSTGDIDAIVASFTDDAVYENVGLGANEGTAAIRAFLDGFLGVMAESIDFEILHQTADGGTVMNERIDTIKFTEGDPVPLRVMGVFEVEGDKITAWRDYFDTASFTGG